MRWLILFLFLPTVSGLSIGASPSSLLFRPLDDTQQLTIMNAGEEEMRFSVENDRSVSVQPEYGTLQSGESLAVTVHRMSEQKSRGVISIYSEGEMIAPGLTIPVKIEEKPGKKKIMIKETIIEEKMSRSNIGLMVITLEIIIGIGLWKKFQK